MFEQYSKQIDELVMRKDKYVTLYYKEQIFT